MWKTEEKFWLTEAWVPLIWKRTRFETVSEVLAGWLGAGEPLVLRAPL